MSTASPQRAATAEAPAPMDEATQVGRRGAKSQPRKTADAGGSQFPTLGEAVFGFRLRQELGRGASARVFLAEQEGLAGRYVALKVTDLQGDEPQTLAQLQHTHIVPIYSVHEHEPTGVRAVCMPFFGGGTLADVLKLVWSQTPRPTTGEQLVTALTSIPDPTRSPSASESPKPEAAASEGGESPLGVLRKMNYFGAAAWLSCRLAEALQHAHQRGVYHRDVKPSNILIGLDGQPMLLDFNVAQSTRNSQTQSQMGGTAAYMAPEHLDAMAKADLSLAAKVDHRADVYSLGMVLYEMVVGGRPYAHTAGYSGAGSILEAMAIERSQVIPSARLKRPDVPWSLESIIGKCLAADPAARYQQAEHLAEDLRRFIEDRPLKYAPELSWKEVAQKWFRRHPRVTSSGSVALAGVLLLAALATGLVGVQRHLSQTREELQFAQAQDRMRSYEVGTRQALCLVNTTSEVRDHLRQGMAVCEKTLALYGVLDADDWEDNPDWRRLSPDDRERLAEDTRELLLSLAWASVHTAPGDNAALENALDLLRRAEKVAALAPCRALWEYRALFLTKLGRNAEADVARQTAQAMPPSSARDHYLLAANYSRSGRYEQAVRELDLALSLDPRHYWSLVQRGICYLELGKSTLAAGDFGACVGLWPEFAWGYFNRAYVLDKSGHRQEAIADYTAALQRDPEFLLAYLNRALALLEMKKYEPALADCRKAAELGRDDVTVHVSMGVALQGLGRFPEADAAFQTAFARAASAPADVRTRLFWVYAFAVSERLPDKARDAFAEILNDHPNHPQALYGKAMLLVREGREAEAITLFDRALKASPDFADARRFRAVLLARAGQFDNALQDVNACLEREPQSGAAHYAAACVAALALAKVTDPEAAKPIAAQAIAFLTKAFALGYGRDRAAKDADLKALRGSSEFVRLLKE